jgi:hypothetical protein
MKTISIALVMGSLAGLIVGLNTSKPKLPEYMADISFMVPVEGMNIKYSSASDGDPSSYTHCGVCKQGILVEQKDGTKACSYCGAK